MDKRSRIDARHALVPQKQTRAVTKPSSVQVKLGRLSEHGKFIADAIPGPVKAASRHSIVFCGRATAVLGAVIFLLIAGVYGRLLAGPISFASLVPTLQQHLNAQLRGYSFRIGDAILRLSAGWGLEFRLANVSLVDATGQEIAKAPFAAIDVSEAALLRLSLAASEISLLGPKILIFNHPAAGLTLTAPPEGGTPTAAGWKPANQPAQKLADTVRQTPASQKQILPFNLAPLLSRVFTALENRGGASSALHRIGMQEAVFYFASDAGVSSWRIADFHIDLEGGSGASALRGELTLQQDDAIWQASFRAVNKAQSKLYSLTASVKDVVPRIIWRSFPWIAPLKLADLPISGAAHFDISYGGEILGAEAEVQFGSGQVFAPFDEKHPAVIDGGLLRVSYDTANESFLVRQLQLGWDDSTLSIRGAITHRTDAAADQAVWTVDLDGSGSQVGAPQFGVQPVSLDVLKLKASYQAASDSVSLTEFRIERAGGGLRMGGQASAISSGGPIAVNGVISPMPVSFLKAIWPAFIANGCRDWIGSNIPAGKITGGSFSVNLTAAALDALSRDGDIPDSAVSVKLGLSGLQIYHIKGLPPIITKDTVARMHGRHFIYDVTGEARIEVPSGRPISFYDGQFIIDDLRPHFPIAEVHFKGAGEVAGVLELLDQPSLGYVRAVGFKPNLINGQASSSFKITFPLLKELKFKQMGLSGKTRVTDLKSNGLPGGLAINGGAVNFDVSETAISANGELKVNNVPVSLVWQRIFDAPPERQPTLRVAAILNEKARDEFGLNINHIVKGDLPVALAVAMQRDGPPKLFMEANLTNTDVFLTAIGWRKPPGQKATVSFDIAQRQDNFIVLDNFVMTGDGLNIGGRLVFNDKRRIAAFAFPEFSTNVLTKLAITGELTPQNILKVQAKGPSYDGRQFFRSLLLGGKTSDDQPAPLKDEPGLDLNVEIDTVFGFYDTTVKSVIIDAKRRDGKLSYLELAGRINGEAPMAVHVDQRHAGTRLLVSDATDAGSVFRLVGFYPAIQGGTMNLRVNLDGSGGVSKAGILDVRNFRITGDQVVGRVVSQAERETARHKQDRRNGGQPAPDDPLVFDRMTVPFSIAGNQFHLHNAAINGPFIGATLKGDIDFSRDTIALSGTYVPFYGANAVFKAVPVLGDILTGGDNEGVFGMTFAIQGRTANPDVVVNPIAMLAPGFLRQIFEFQTAPAQSWPAEGSQAPAAQVRGKPRTTAD